MWKCYRQQGTGFELENYITPGAYLCVSEEPENDSDTEYWKVYFSEVRKSNYTSALVIIILIAVCCISSG